MIIQSIHSIIFLFLTNLLFATEVSFERVSPYEIPKIRDHLILFYAESLLRASLFDNFEVACEAAKEEVSQEEQNTEFQYLYIYSNISEKTNCGYLVVSFGNDTTAYIEAIEINQTFRNQGFGKATLRYLEFELQDIGIRTIKLFVFAHNKIAISLYNKLGYLIENQYERNGKTIGYHMKKNITCD